VKLFLILIFIKKITVEKHRKKKEKEGLWRCRTAPTLCCKSIEKAFGVVVSASYETL
jgi:hypothetical protein